MSTTKIALRLPGIAVTNGYFSIKLQSQPENLPCIYGAARHLFVIAGSKDQFRRFCQLLIKHRIIDRRLRWTFGEERLVIFGNNCAPSEPDANWWWFLYALDQKARAKGGSVHFLPGPHELMHIDGSWQYEHPAYPAATAKLRSPFTALYGANSELRRWLGTRNVVEKIGRLLFLHYDLLPLLNTHINNLPELNIFIRSMCSQLPKTLPSPPPANDRKILNDNIDWRPGVETISQLLQQFSVERIVTGNSLQTQINIDFDGKFIQAGTNFTDGNPAGLFIKRRRFMQADHKGYLKKIKL